MAQNLGSWEFGIVEWLWEHQAIRVVLPGLAEQRLGGSYDEVVTLLSRLGREGWDVASCVAAGNWILWTLKRTVIAPLVA